MGQGIIFVGSGNLNRNKDQQSMYGYGYQRKRINKRDLFYNELCIESRKVPSKKVRKKKMQQLNSKYMNSACSIENMEKVFIAYQDCFQKVIKKKEYKVKVRKLPFFLEKHHVDKRIIKRILEIEQLDHTVKDIEKKKDIKNTANRVEGTNSTSQLVKIKKERANKFYELLNEYLIKSSFDNSIVMSSELNDLFKVFKRDANYVGQLKLIYQGFISQSSESISYSYLKKIRKKYNTSISRTDLKALIKYFNTYQEKRD